MFKLNGQRVKFRIFCGGKTITLANFKLAEAKARAEEIERITPGVSLFYCDETGALDYVNFSPRPERRE